MRHRGPLTPGMRQARRLSRLLRGRHQPTLAHQRADARQPEHPLRRSASAASAGSTRVASPPQRPKIPHISRDSRWSRSAARQAPISSSANLRSPASHRPRHPSARTGRSSVKNVRSRAMRGRSTSRQRGAARQYPADEIYPLAPVGATGVCGVRHRFGGRRGCRAATAHPSGDRDPRTPGAGARTSVNSVAGKAAMSRNRWPKPPGVPYSRTASAVLHAVSAG
jgi:hypothetical protein